MTGLKSTLDVCWTKSGSNVVSRNNSNHKVGKMSAIDSNSAGVMLVMLTGLEGSGVL